MSVWTVMELQAVLLVLIGILALSSSQSCGTVNCSQDYNSTCVPDQSCALYGSCMTSQSECNTTIAPAVNISVNCFDTCIVGHPITPSIPLKCCADSILISETISTTTGDGFLIARLYSPNESGLGIYRHNTYCNYNVQCPSEEYDLHYSMVRFDIEPPETTLNDTCLDFLRYHFTATGASAERDACGKLENLTPILKSGVHGSALNVDFRSNRIDRTMDFFLAVVCIKTGGGSRRKRQSLTDSVKVSPTDCTSTFSFDQRVVRDHNDVTQSTEKYLDEVFPTAEATSKVQRITVTRAGVVLYRDKTIVVRRDGKTQYKFGNIKELQVYNKIEGFLTFSGSASPRTRTFPGYGFLQVGAGIAQYYQTLVDPRFLLNDEEQVIVRVLLNELFDRRTFDAERFYLEPPRIDLLSSSSEKVNCSINELAELNRNSCTNVVRAVANFFLEKDSNVQQICNL